MHTRSQIKRRLSEPSSIERLRHTLSQHNSKTRSQLADMVCEEFCFRDPRGHLQSSGCHRALLELEAAGHVSLPPARTRTGPHRPQPGKRHLDPAPSVPEQCDELQGLEVVLVKTKADLDLWVVSVGKSDFSAIYDTQATCSTVYCLYSRKRLRSVKIKSIQPYAS